MSKRSNQVMQRIASKVAIDLVHACHPLLGCEPRLLGLAVADLVFVRR